MQVKSMEDFNKLEKPRVQNIPGFYGEELIEGMVIKDLKMFSDERGFLTELIRLDDEELKAPNIKQIIAIFLSRYDQRMASPFQTGRSSGLRYWDGKSCII